VGTEAWIPDNVPMDRPSSARMYDYFLGGWHNFAIDRQAADAAAAIYPDFPLVMRANRAFLYRAVRFLAQQGIDQFLDIGSGIPTVGNVHEVAQRLNPASRVVYVDIDPIAVAHSEAILQGNAQATIIQADAREPERILEHAAVRPMFASGRPVAVLLAAVLPFIADGDVAQRVAKVFRDALPPGGYVALSHGTHDSLPAPVIDQLLRLYAGTTNPYATRTQTEIAAYFDGLDLVAPGLVLTPLWRPDRPDDLLLDDPVRAAIFAGVGFKR
jgi:SAM-dependent methyltransferase